MQKKPLFIIIILLLQCVFLGCYEYDYYSDGTKIYSGTSYINVAYTIR